MVNIAELNEKLNAADKRIDELSKNLNESFKTPKTTNEYDTRDEYPSYCFPGDMSPDEYNFDDVHPGTKVRFYLNPISEDIRVLAALVTSENVGKVISIDKEKNEAVVFVRGSYYANKGGWENKQVTLPLSWVKNDAELTRYDNDFREYERKVSQTDKKEKKRGFFKR